MKLSTIYSILKTLEERHGDFEVKEIQFITEFRGGAELQHIEVISNNDVGFKATNIIRKEK